MHKEDEERTKQAEDNFRIELWTKDQSRLIAVVNKSANSRLHHAARDEAIQQYPGHLLVIYNARFVTQKIDTPNKPDIQKEATLGDLREFHIIHTWCGICKRSNMFSPENFRNRFGFSTPINAIEGRLKCKECGSRDQVSLKIANKPRG